MTLQEVALEREQATFTLLKAADVVILLSYRNSIILERAKERPVSRSEKTEVKNDSLARSNQIQKGQGTVF